MRTPTPADLATARAVLIDEEYRDLSPAVRQAAWNTFAAARGVRIDWDSLERLHDFQTRHPAALNVAPIRHFSVPARLPAAPAATLTATLAQIAPRITAAVTRRLHDGGAA